MKVLVVLCASLVCAASQEFQDPYHIPVDYADRYVEGSRQQEINLDYGGAFLEDVRPAIYTPGADYRRKRSAVLYSAVLPAALMTTVKYTDAEAIDAATPADTKKVELKEKEAEVVLPFAAPFAPFAAIAPIAPVPYTIISPLPAVKYSLYEPVDAATPADTKQIELKKKDAEVTLPYAAPLPLVPHQLVVL